MRHVVTWHQVTTYSAAVDVGIADLAAWAIKHAPIAALGVAGAGLPEPAVLTRSIQLNPHLRARLLQLYADCSDQAIETSARDHPSLSGQPRDTGANQKTKTRAHHDRYPRARTIHTENEQGESS